MAGPDDTALLRLLVDVREGISEVARFTQSYKADIESLADATAAGAGPSSEQFVRLRDRALASGASFLKAGEQGLAAMTELALATGKPVAEAKVLEAELKVVREQLRLLRTESVSAAGGVDLISSNVTKLGSKFATFSSGLLAGFAIGPLLGLLSSLVDGLKQGAEGIRDYVAEVAAGGAATSRLGEQTRTLGDSILILARREDEAADRQARLTAAQLGFARSVEDIRAATDQYAARVAAVEDTFTKQFNTAKNLEEVRLALATRTRDLAKAEREYHDVVSGQVETLQFQLELGRQYADQINAEIAARNSVRDAVLGNADSLAKETAALLSVIAEVNAHGGATKEQAANIVEAVTAQLAKYEEYGLKVPPQLDAVIKALGILTAEQKKAKEGADALNAAALKSVEEKVRAQQAEGAASVKTQQDAKGRVESIQAEIAALESATVLTAEQSDRLFSLQTDLTSAQNDLRAATAAAANALQTQGDAAEIAQNQMAELVNQYGLATGEIDALGNTVRGSNPDLLAAATNLGTAADASGDLAAGSDSAAAAVAGLAQRQNEGRLGAEAMAEATDDLRSKVAAAGEAAEKAGPQIKSATAAAREDAEAYEAVMVRLAESHLPKIVDLVKEWKREQGGEAEA